MWIIDLQLPLDEIRPPTGAQSRVLERNLLYELGRYPDSKIWLNLQKVSRHQSNIEVLDDDTVKFSNVGNATWIFGEKEEELKGGKKDVVILKTNTTFKLRSVNWKLQFFKVPDFQISPILKSKVNDLKFINVSNDLTEDSILINGAVKKIKNMDDWIKKMNSKSWETTGQLNRYIVPELEPEYLALDEDSDISPIEKTPAREDEETDKLIEIKPFYTQLSNREAKRSRKSQLERMFDEMDDLDDLETYTSQSTQKAKTQPKESKPASPTPLPVESVNEDLSNLSLKRKITAETQPSVKKVKLSITSDVETIKETMKESLNVPAIAVKVQSSTQGGNRLAEMFKKTKQMKMDKLSEEEKMVNDVSKQPSNMVKIKKFQVNLQQNGTNPKVYSNYKMSYGSNPKWENRLNYSKFTKSTNGVDYNPIMDSTIKTVKFKNSNYKSNEIQVNLDQHDDMIPELDNMFPEENSKAISTRKRRRENMLFVDSDDEEEEYQSSRRQSQRQLQRPSQNLNSEYSTSHETARSQYHSRNMHATQQRREININRYADGLNDDNDDDDETPVFRSRRR